jgi:rhodanese-related sulfurtransferase
VKFIQDNLLLVAVALVSGAMLLWPLVRRGAGGAWIDPALATNLINREDALVVDVREPGEFGTGHILGARNLPLARIDAGEVDIKAKEKPLILCCDNGNRSSKAAAALKKLGFTRVHSLNGGIGAWRQAGLPVEK